MKWYQKNREEVLKKLNSSQNNGLTKSTVVELQQTHGLNTLKSKKPISPLTILLMQFNNPLIFILFLGIALSLYSSHTIDAIAISVIIIINVSIGFFQELKMRKSMDALKNMAAPIAQVYRDASWLEVPASDLVPGDIIKLVTGNKIQADIRIIEATQLLIEEAALTGESEPIEKFSNTINKDGLDIADWQNMAFMGTQILAGNGLGVVCETGMNTQLGHIATMMQDTKDERTPLQERIHALSKMLIIAAFVVVAMVIGIGIEQGMVFVDMVGMGISLTVAAIPEGLPTVVTIVLTIGAKEMSKNNALIKKLSSVETLGSTTVICSDKTGTLTQNKMQVLSIYAAGKYYDITGTGYETEGTFYDENKTEVNQKDDEDLYKLLQISAICNDAQIVSQDGTSSIIGTPTEGAVAVVAAKAGISKDAMLENCTQIIHSFAFDSARKIMSLVIKTADDKYFVVVKGAPDVVAQRSEHIYLHGKTSPLDSTTLMHIDEAIDTFASRALRTLAVAFKPLQASHLDLTQEGYEHGFTFLGVHSIIDPPRKEVIPAVKECHSAGIQTIMITGDYAQTAEAIAREIGFMQPGIERVIIGSELNAMSDEELQEALKETSVFARVVPEHKLIIINALKANGEVAAITGDGINDAPAIKSADIGIAMGITGTDVTKDSADLILLDDNFTTIVKAVREGVASLIISKSLSVKDSQQM